MAEATLSPELLRSVERLARTLLAAGRAVTLYPPEHPAVGASLTRLQNSVKEATGGVALTLGVTPTTFLVEGAAAGSGEGPVAEAAALLHNHDLLEVTFTGDTPRAALTAFLTLLGTDPEQLRTDGGPAAVWVRGGHTAIAIEQGDNQTVLEDRESRRTPSTRDDLWRSIVRAVSERHKTLDEAAQRRLLEIAGDADAIGELTGDVLAPARTPDGSPMITTQAAAVLAAYRHLSSIVSVLAPERRDEVMRNLANATSRLDPRVVMQVLTSEDDPGAGGAGVVTGIVNAFDDVKVAQLLATTLAIDGQASQRLAEVFDTIAPDAERKQRVLRLTRTLLKDTDFGQRNQFESLWGSMEELLLTYNERPFVGAAYRESLDQAGARAETMAAADLPLETLEWVHTLGQENVRRLSVTLLIDLLNLEKDPDRATEVANDVATIAEDLLMSGDYDQALRVVKALGARVADPGAVTSKPSRLALEHVAVTPAMREAADLFGDLDDTQTEQYSEICRQIGPSSTDALLPLLSVEPLTRGRSRATEIVAGMGAPVVSRLQRLVSSDKWYAQRNAAELLGRIGTPDAVPLLQPLLRGTDPRVAREAVRALSHIDDPSAARAVHTVLRTSTGDMRQAVVTALVAARDPRVVPVLLRILNESEPLRSDHPIVLDTLAALGTLGQDSAIADIARLMRRRSVFARKKVRAIKQGALDALRAIGTSKAAAAIQEAATTGDRMLRRMARGMTA